MENLKNHRGGMYRSNLSGDMSYTSFVPAPLPPSPPLAQSDVPLLIDAHKYLSALNSAANRIPSVKLFVSMYVRKEALLSSQIEGTQATLDDILDPLHEENLNQEVSDVVNYIQATEYALKRRESLPLCNRLLRETHKKLMDNVRGQERDPGEFRKSQNWIGRPNCTLSSASYVPPNVEDMYQALADLEIYINNDDNVELDVLVKTALIHYQFETIHPFLDGNGRVGRLLITLYMIEKDVLSSPALYISYFLKLNRIEYYDRMMEVRRKGSYEQWVVFFLRALCAAAKDALETIDQLIPIREKNLLLLSSLGRSSETAEKVFAYLEEHPIINIQRTANELSISYNTVANAISRLIEKNILVPAGKTGRSRTFEYKEYLDVLRKGTEIF